MKKSNLIFVTIILISSLFITNSTSAQDRKGPPPNGERKGPPGGGHNPEQTKTLEEIGGYKIGDVATDFKLKNVDETLFSLSDIKDAKGYIVVFTCNECPFAKMYEDRLIALHNTYAPKGYSVIAINPNVSEDNDRESFAAMQKRAKEKEFPFVYLADEKHEVFPKYGAVRTPHVFLLDSERKVQYIGTIDNNAKSAEDVTIKYVENAIDALENGKKPMPNFTKAIGCPVKGI
jgi:peroxiredoxin